MAQNVALMTIISISGVSDDVMAQEEKQKAVEQADQITNQLDCINDRAANMAIDAANIMIDENTAKMRFLTEDEMSSMDPDYVSKILESNQSLLDENKELLDGIDSILDGCDNEVESKLDDPENDYAAPAPVNTVNFSM